MSDGASNLKQTRDVSYMGIVRLFLADHCQRLRYMFFFHGIRYTLYW